MVQEWCGDGPEGRGSRGMAGRFYLILKDCRDLERIGDFWKWECCPDAMQRAASAVLITIAPPPIPSLAPAVLCHLFPFNGPTIREWNPGIHIQHCGWCNPLQAASPCPPISPHSHRHFEKIPCGYLDVLSIRKWKWETEQIKALCHPRCLVHVLRFFLAAELIWWANRFADGEIVGPRRTEAHRETLPCQGCGCARVAVTAYRSYPNPKITSARSGLFLCCPRGRMVKLYHRFKPDTFHNILSVMGWVMGWS